jgi:hypothetical protein
MAYIPSPVNVRSEPCEHCGTPRDPNKTLPCPLCGSRHYPIIGYSYEHEARTVLLMGSIIAVALLLAVVVGATVFVTMLSQLH